MIVDFHPRKGDGPRAKALLAEVALWQEADPGTRIPREAEFRRRLIEARYLDWREGQVSGDRRQEPGAR